MLRSSALESVTSCQPPVKAVPAVPVVTATPFVRARIASLRQIGQSFFDVFELVSVVRFKAASFSISIAVPPPSWALKTEMTHLAETVTALSETLSWSRPPISRRGLPTVALFQRT